MREVTGILALGLGLAALALGCGRGEVPGSEAAAPGSEAAPAAPRVARVAISGRLFDLELALDDRTRRRGLGGRTSIPEHGGMLFVWPRAEPRAMVMRDCPAPIDVAFLDATGRVLAVHAMAPEPPRRPGEAPDAYESRLPSYASPQPAQLAVETAGGRLLALGVRGGDRFVIDDLDILIRRAR